MSIFIAFILAVVTFYINHRIKKVTDTKILINTLFELYGEKSSFDRYDRNDVENILLNEILSIEKQYDDNPYVKREVNKLEKLRMLYHKFNKDIDLDLNLKAIGFKKLRKDFIILSYLNMR